MTELEEASWDCVRYFLEWETVVNKFKWGEGGGRLVIDKGLYYDTVTHRIQLNY